MSIPPLQNGVNSFPEFLAPVDCQQILSNRLILNAEYLYSALVIRKNLIIAVYDKQTFAHIFRNHRKFLLLFFQFPDAMLNFPVLCRNPLQKRRQLIIGFHLLRVLEV